MSSIQVDKVVKGNLVSHNHAGATDINGPLAVTNSTPNVTGSASQVNTGDVSTKGLIVQGASHSPASAQPDTLANLVLWLKADAITGLNDGDAVASWADSSSAGNTVTQSTGSKKPIYKTNIINGLPVLRFTGSSSQELTIALPVVTATTNVTIIAIGVPSTTSVKGPLIKIGNNATGYGIGVGAGDWDSNGNNIVGLYETVAWLATGNSFGSTVAIETLTIGATGTPTVYKNGTSVFTSGSTPFAPTSTTNIGGYPSGTRYFTGDIAEIIVYNALLSTVQRASIETYLANRYGISVTALTQTANLQEWQNGSGTVVGSVDSAGKIAVGASAPRQALDAGTGSIETGDIIIDGTPATFASSWPFVRNGIQPKAFMYLDSTSNILRIGTQKPSSYDSIAFEVPHNNEYQDLIAMNTSSFAPAAALDNSIDFGLVANRWKSLHVGTGASQFDGTLALAKTASYTAELDNGNSGTSKTIDWTAKNVQKVTLTGNCTFTFTAPAGPANLVLRTVGDGTVRTIIWPATVKWPASAAPTMTGTSAHWDVIRLYYDGTNYSALIAQDYS